MTAKELIAILSQYPENTEIAIKEMEHGDYLIPTTATLSGEHLIFESEQCEEVDVYVVEAWRDGDGFTLCTTFDKQLALNTAQCDLCHLTEYEKERQIITISRYSFCTFLDDAEEALADYADYCFSYPDADDCEVYWEGCKAR